MGLTFGGRQAGGQNVGKWSGDPDGSWSRIPDASTLPPAPIWEGYDAEPAPPPVDRATGRPQGYVGCEECGISRPPTGPCPNPRCVDHYFPAPDVPARAPVDDAPLPWEEPSTPPPTRATPNFYRQNTPLVEELDALTGYDSAGLFAAYMEAVQKRHDAKRRIAELSAHAVTLRARFESKGTMPSQAEHERSQKLAELAEQVRLDYYRAPDVEEQAPKRKGEDPIRKVVRLSNDEVAQRARAHPEYRSFLEAQGQQRADYEQVKRDLDEAWADYELQAGITEYLGSQLEDRKSMVYYASKEWRHRDANAGA